MGGGEKTSETIFIETHEKCEKIWEEIVGKCRKKRFLYSHEYRDQKREEKNETHEKCKQKMLGKKSSEKSAKKRFFIFTRMS